MRTPNNTDFNNPPNHLPGLYSPLAWGSFLLGTGLLLFGKSTNDYDCAVYALAIAGTALMTNNKVARHAAVIGGAMRLCSSALIGTLGFLAQGAALTYAADESTNILATLRNLAEQDPAARRIRSLRS